jgi:hypothetical protein
MSAGVFPFLRRVFSVSMIPSQLLTFLNPFGGAAMEGRPFLRRKDREALRERWLLRAGQAFERMFAEANQDQLVTFTEREDAACLLGKELAAFLLEEHTAADSEVRPSEKRPPACPKCKKPGERVTESDEKLPQRDLTTRAGKIKVQREQWQCRKCRILFFSVRPKAEPGHGGIQSAAVAKGGATGGPGSLVRGSQ